MASADLVFRLFARNEGASEEMDKVGDSAEHTADKIDKANGKKITIEGEDADNLLKRLSRDAEDTGNKTEGAQGGAEGMGMGLKVLMGAAVALAPALAGLGPAILGIGTAAGAVGLAFGGIGAALQDYSQAQAGAGQVAAQAAMTAFQNAEQLRNAEQQLTTAEQNEMYAQQALTLARQQASNQIQDLNNAEADAALGVQGAQLALQQAQKNEIDIMNQGTATALQRAQAQLAVRQAQQSLIDSEQKSKEATAAANIANQQGVNNLPAVVQAQRAQQQAALQVAQAHQNITDTLKQQQLQAAVTAASGSSGFNQFALAMAKLSPAGRAFVDQLIAMRPQFEQLRHAAEESMLPAFTTMLRQSGQILPILQGGITQTGQTIAGVANQFTALFTNAPFLAALRTAMGSGIGLIGQLASSFAPLFQALVQVGVTAGPIVNALGAGLHAILASGLPAFLAGLTVNAGGAAQGIGAILHTVSSLLGPLGTLIGAVAGALGPVLAALLPVVANLVSQFVGALLPVLPQLSSTALDFVNVLAQILPLVGQLLPVFATLITQDLQILAPLLRPIADLFQATGHWLVPLASGAVLAASGIRGITAAYSLAKIATELFTKEGLIAQAMTKAWTAIQAAFDAVMDANPIALVIVAIAALVAGVIYAWNHFAWFRDGIKQLWQDLKNWFGDGLQFVEGVWHRITDGVHALGSAIGGVFSGIGSTVSGAFSALLGIVRGPINAVISLVNEVIGFLDSIQVSVPSWVPFVGGQSFGVSIPKIPMLAAGGDITAGGLALVGERGPELVQLNAGARVNPLPPGGLGGSLGSADQPLHAILDLRLNGQHVDNVLVRFQREGGVLESMNTAIATSGRVLAGR